MPHQTFFSSTRIYVSSLYCYLIADNEIKIMNICIVDVEIVIVYICIVDVEIKTTYTYILFPALKSKIKICFVTVCILTLKPYYVNPCADNYMEHV